MFPLVQCVVIVGSALTIEIGDRTLLADASFVVGAGEKVGLVGRNGTGKSSFISVLVGETSPQLRHRGNVRLLGSFGYLPQAPVPAGLGLEPTGFSHILSARGLDVLDDALGTARTAMADDPSEENIELFTDLQEQFQSNGGYEAESIMARLADGLGLRQELLLEDIDELSGGQRRRVDLMRVLFQEPDLMILDEPTNHLDRSAKRLAARGAGAVRRRAPRGEPRPPPARPVHHQGAAHREPAPDGVEGQLLQVRGAARGRPVPTRARVTARVPRDQAPLDTGRLHAGEHREAGPQGQGARPARRADGGGADAGGQARACQQILAPGASALRGHPARGGQAGRPLRQQRGAVGGDVPCRAGRPHRDHRPQRRREVFPAALPGWCAGALQRRGRAGGERRVRLLRPGARADRPRPPAPWTT